jgi:hypothetical protein
MYVALFCSGTVNLHADGCLHDSSSTDNVVFSVFGDILLCTSQHHVYHVCCTTLPLPSLAIIALMSEGSQVVICLFWLVGRQSWALLMCRGGRRLRTYQPLFSPSYQPHWDQQPEHNCTVLFIFGEPHLIELQSRGNFRWTYFDAVLWISLLFFSANTLALCMLSHGIMLYIGTSNKNQCENNWCFLDFFRISLLSSSIFFRYFGFYHSKISS